MKKAYGVPLIILTFTWINVTSGNISGEIPIESLSQVIADLQKQFHSGCVYILQAIEEEKFGKTKL
jgi:tRNA A37 threonylcarbamoyladenosine synthetase subunit TsaC/SUA5/YrdC